MKRGIILVLVLMVVFKSPRAVWAKATLPEFLQAPGEETGRKTVLFLMAHYDDDSVISGTLSLYKRAGWEVHLAWVTAAGTGGPWFGTPELRLSEAKKAAAVYGLDDAHLHVLGFPDRGAIDDLPGVCDKATELIREIKPSVVITCAYEGGHWDHDSTCLAAYVASRRVDFSFVRFEVPTYNAYGFGLMRWGINHFIPSAEETHWVKLDRECYRVRKAVRRAYRSQWFFMVPFGILGTYRHLTGRGEPIRKTPDYDFLNPPHEGKLLYQRPEGVAPGASFERWRQGVLAIPEFSGGK